MRVRTLYSSFHLRHSSSLIFLRLPFYVVICFMSFYVCYYCLNRKKKREEKKSYIHTVEFSFRLSLSVSFFNTFA